MGFLQQLQHDFVREAKTSPTLLRDLAVMERYIAESYTDRALIELLQNADDAGSSRFLAYTGENYYLVANDGRPLDHEDATSLCRSGASTKIRGDGSIGYRGIGFKSVVDFSDCVHVVSNDLQFSFSRDRSRTLLDVSSEIPLLRIPHKFETSSYNLIIHQLLHSGFTTIFIFESRSQQFQDELSKFTPEAMLFLNSVNTFEIIDSTERVTYLVERSENGFESQIKLSHAGAPVSNWLVVKQVQKPEALAINLENDTYSRCEPSNAVFHSFLPTSEACGLFARVNGDFSTDPSRTKIKNDDHTDATIDRIVQLISEYFSSLLRAGEDKYDVIGALADSQTSPFDQLRDRTARSTFLTKMNTRLRMDLEHFYGSRVYLRPNWLDPDDSSVIEEHLEMSFIDSGLPKLSNSLHALANVIRVETLDTASILSVPSLTLNRRSSIGLLASLSSGNAHFISKDLIDLVTQKARIPASGMVKPIVQLDGKEHVDPDFIESLIEEVGDVARLESLLKRLNLDYLIQNSSLFHTDGGGSAVQNVSKSVRKSRSGSPVPISSRLQQGSDGTHYRIPGAAIPKWRSVELNFADLLRSLDSVAEVEDVSKRNLGYDLKAIDTDGNVTYLEVKSVDRLGERVSLTNNEYSTAVDKGRSYSLAIVEQTDSAIEVCIIEDPLHNLELHKQAVGWQWVIDEYQGRIFKFEY